TLGRPARGARLHAAPQAALRPMLFTGIDHPALSCYDVSRQIDWYCRNFDMRVIASNGQTPPSAVIGYDGSPRGAAMIEMMPAKDPGPRPADAPRFQPG